ncbi:MAG: hypothetical protein N2316_10480 [Spirochaetes bacterium]|nr:hypothetical protein [Spirochaetota bacterium]
MNAFKVCAFYFILMILLMYTSKVVATSFEMRITPSSQLTGAGLDFYDYEATSQRLTEYLNLFAQKNNEVIPSGLVLANVLGYPNGRAMIGMFPHLTVGITAGISTYKLFRYQDFETDNPEVPGAGANAAVFFGTGIDKNMDIMFKIFALGSYYVYDREIEQSVTHDATIERELKLTITDNSLYSFGAKTRYNIFQPRSRGLISFSGLNVNLSFDYLAARFAARGEYKTTKQVDLTMPFMEGTPISTEVLATVTGSAAVQWHFFSITPEVMAYLNILYFLNVYTGFAFSVNRGVITFETDATGALINTADIKDQYNTILVPANSTIATAVLHADSSMKPVVFFPRYIIGLEFDFLLVKVALEASTVLTSPADSFTAQIGVRTEL